MRISDWSSDVCSSDLQHLEVFSLNFEASKALKSHRNGFRVDSRNDQVASFSGLNRFRRGDCVTNFAEDDHVGIASHGCLDRPGKIQADRLVHLDMSHVRDEIGRAHVCNPVTNTHLVCRILLETKKTKQHNIISHMHIMRSYTLSITI